MKTIEKEVKIELDLDIDEIYECLGSREKRELFERIYDDKEMEEYYTDSIKEKYDIDIKTMYHEESFSHSLVSLIDKEHMMTKEETEMIKTIARKYKYFD
jgi:hypothetical protein